MEASVDEFLEIVAELFKNMGSVVEETFKDSSSSNSTRSTRSSTTGGGGGGGADSSQSPAGPPALEADGSAVTGAVVHQPAMRSFKLLQDCPASIVFIFQTYRPMVNKAITIFVPLVFDVSSLSSSNLESIRSMNALVMQFIQLQAAPQARKHASMEPGQTWVGVCPEIPKDKRASFESMVMAQIKVSSFVSLSSWSK